MRLVQHPLMEEGKAKPAMWAELHAVFLVFMEELNSRKKTPYLGLFLAHSGECPTRRVRKENVKVDRTNWVILVIPS